MQDEGRVNRQPCAEFRDKMECRARRRTVASPAVPIPEAISSIYSRSPAREVVEVCAGSGEGEQEEVVVLLPDSTTPPEEGKTEERGTLTTCQSSPS